MLFFKKIFALKALPFIFTLFIIVVFLFWYGATPIKNLVPTNSLSSSPDYFITQLNVKEFDSNGALIETLNAEQTLHYIDQSKTILESPTINRQLKSGSWSAEADKGVIKDGSNDILLTENARATKKHLESGDITFSADSVHYLDKHQSLTSSGNATLISTQGKTTASTIITFINSEKVVMTGSVRGKYETAH